ncbi:MAG: lipoyl(octanoyl) transferase LipB, partial [Lentisphaerae bacterium]|nr:lipoyl(octanoyl) transferase LipB [Lentisphaerota bacterium]
MQTLAVQFDKPIPYAEAVAIQEKLVRARLDEKLPDTVLLLEHPPVITIGNRGRRNYLLLSQEALARRGIALYESSRGGDVTYHAPGQLIIYPIIRLGANEADTHGYLHNLEEVALRTAADFGVQAFRRPGMTGAWTAAGKLAAIGIRLKRWVTSHGMSFNVCPDMTGFQAIV